MKERFGPSQHFGRTMARLAYAELSWRSLESGTDSLRTWTSGQKVPLTAQDAGAIFRETIAIGTAGYDEPWEQYCWFCIGSQTDKGLYLWQFVGADNDNINFGFYFLGRVRRRLLRTEGHTSYAIQPGYQGWTILDRCLQGPRPRRSRKKTTKIDLVRTPYEGPPNGASPLWTIRQILEGARRRTAVGNAAIPNTR